MKLLFYTKPGCCLCDILKSHLLAIDHLELEFCDVTTRSDWWDRYRYRIPVVTLPNGEELRELTPRLSTLEVQEIVARYA